ncbi:hypothetical protein D3C71_1572060 [compost metagenome]
MVRTLPCSRVPTGTLLVSSWVRVATWLALACCSMIARRLLSVWLTVTWLPWGRGWLALACSWVWVPLACISRSTSWKSWPTWRNDMTSACAVSPGAIKPGCGCVRRSSSPVMPALMAWGLIAVCAPRLLISVMIVYNLSSPASWQRGGACNNAERPWLPV